jgi:hypothetical protein
VQADTGLSDQLFEVTAERDQANSKALRLEARLNSLFDAELTLGQSSQKVPSATPSTLRENELIATIAAFQRALEQKNKAIGHMVPASKYMQVHAACHQFCWISTRACAVIMSRVNTPPCERAGGEWSQGHQERPAEDSTGATGSSIAEV